MSSIVDEIKEGIYKLYRRVSNECGNEHVDATSRQILCLTSEVGELANAIKIAYGWSRKSGLISRDKAERNIAEEMADVYISLAVLAEMYDIELNDEISRKLVMIENRGGI